MGDKEPKYVKWHVFAWAIGLITLILFSSISISMVAQAKASKAETDIGWIKESLETIQSDIKTLLTK